MEYAGEKRNPAAVIVFTFVTCGIYALVWIYKFARDMKVYLDREDINPGLDLLLCIICFPFIIYWSYKYGKLLTEAQEKAALPLEDNSLLYLILAMCGLFVVVMAIMQDSVNRVWSKVPA